MQIIKKMTLDLENVGITPRVSAVQNDANTRALEITLTASSEPWQVPEGITAAVAYRKPDGTRGLYDTLPGGSSAVSISGNVITAILAPQALTVAGEISAAVILNDKNLNQLATFPFVIMVAPNPAAGAASDNYYAYSTLKEINAAVDAMMHHTEQTLNGSLSSLFGSFTADFEIGNITLADNALAYESSNGIIRTKEGSAYFVPAGSSFTLSDYAKGSLEVFCSYDGGNTYFAASRTAANSTPIIIEKNAIVALRIQSVPWKTQKDTSLGDLLVADIRTIFESLDSAEENIKAANNRICLLDGKLDPEFELGSITVTDNALVYSDSKGIVRTKEGSAYFVPAGSTFGLRDYSTAILTVLYSYDGGNTYFSATRKATGDTTPVEIEQNARIALAIQSEPWKNQKDTSLADLLVVDIRTIPERLDLLEDDANQLASDIQIVSDSLDGTKRKLEAMEGDLNHINLWEKGGINNSGNNYIDSSCARTKDYLSQDVELVYVEKDYCFFTAVYDSEDNFVGFWNGKQITASGSTVFYLNPTGLQGYKIRLVCKRRGASKIDVSECANIHFLNNICKNVFFPQPTLTFIDDDGALEALENWESISDEIGVKITSALNTGVMGDGENNPTKASWDDVERLQNKGFEFVSHTHGHINILTVSEESCINDFKNSIAALKEHGCESRFLVYPYNAITTEKIPLVRKYFSAGVGLGSDESNRLPLYTYWIRRHSINGTQDPDTGVYAFKDLETLKGHIDTAIINGGWVIIMTHLRNFGEFYYNEDIRQRIIDLCKYAVEKGVVIQTFGEAFERYKNVMEQSTASVYDSKYYIVDCNGVMHYKEETE